MRSAQRRLATLKATDERACHRTSIARPSVDGPSVVPGRDRDIARLDALDAGLGHVGPGFCKRALGVDAAAGVFDHIGFKARLACIDRGPCDAEVGGEAGQEHALHLARLQVSGEPRRGLAVRFGEGRIAVDVLVKTLADDEPGMRDREVFRQRRALGALHAVIGPQHLLAVREADALERLLAGMRRRERDVARGVPVLRHHHIGKALGEAVDDGNDLFAVFDREAAARQETVLHVDDDQRGCLVGLDRCGPKRRWDEGGDGRRAETCQNKPASNHGASPRFKKPTGEMLVLWMHERKPEVSACLQVSGSAARMNSVADGAEARKGLAPVVAR